MFCLAAKKEVNFDYTKNQKCDLMHMFFDKHTWKMAESNGT